MPTKLGIRSCHHRRHHWHHLIHTRRAHSHHYINLLPLYFYSKLNKRKVSSYRLSDSTSRWFHFSSFLCVPVWHEWIPNNKSFVHAWMCVNHFSRGGNLIFCSWEHASNAHDSNRRNRKRKRDSSHPRTRHMCNVRFSVSENRTSTQTKLFEICRCDGIARVEEMCEHFEWH